MITDCPECGDPAWVVYRRVLESTEGPLEHRKLRCINRHWFALPTGWLSLITNGEDDGASQATEPQQD